MFDTYPAPLRMSRVTDRNGNWLNSDSYCIFHMACLHELGALRLQTAAPEYAAAPRDRRERLFVSLFTQHFSMRHNKLCDNKKKKERKQSKSAKRLNKRHVRTGTAGRGRPQIWSRERVCSKRSGATSREPQTNKQTNDLSDPSLIRNVGSQESPRGFWFWCVRVFLSWIDQLTRFEISPATWCISPEVAEEAVGHSVVVVGCRPDVEAGFKLKWAVNRSAAISGSPVWRDNGVCCEMSVF